MIYRARRRVLHSVDAPSSWVLLCQKNKKGCVLNFYQKINHKPFGFFDIMKPRRKENLPSQYIILSDPVFNKTIKNMQFAKAKRMFLVGKNQRFCLIPHPLLLAFVALQMRKQFFKEKFKKRNPDSKVSAQNLLIIYEFMRFRRISASFQNHFKICVL